MMAISSKLGLTPNTCLLEFRKEDSKNVSVIGRYTAKKFVTIGGIVATIAFMAITFFTRLRVFAYASFPFGALVSLAINKIYDSQKQAFVDILWKIVAISETIIPTNKTFKELVRLASFDMRKELCKTMNAKQLETVRTLVSSKQFRLLIQEKANPAHGDFRKLDEYLQKNTSQKIELYKNEVFSAWLTSNIAMQRLILQDALKQNSQDKILLTECIDELTGYYYKNQKITTFTFAGQESEAYSKEWLFSKCGLINGVMCRFTEVESLPFDDILTSNQDFQDLNNCFKILRGIQDLPEDLN